MKVACCAFEPKINNTCGGKDRAIALTYKAAAIEAVHTSGDRTRELYEK
jgi:hypothetical protein